MKFKVGDKVRIRKDLVVGKRYAFGWVFSEDMEKFKGKMATIKKINDDYLGKYYTLDISSPVFGRCYHYGWSEDMLEPVGRFFKNLPNDYTGTIEVENGFIIEKEILDDKEKEYLNAVIRPFRDKIKYIRKLGTNKEYINVSLECADGMSFPYFDKGTMYKGMELNKEYTLKELGLDE